MFAEHVQECRSLAEMAKKELDQLRGAPEGERAAIDASVFNLLKQADDGLLSLQLEARSASPHERAQLMREEEHLRGDLRVVAKELEQLRRELLLSSNEGKVEKLFKARDERKRALVVTDTLSRGRDHLKAAKNQVAESERIGIDTLQELRRQRETICRMKDNTHDMGYDLDDAQKSLTVLEKPQCCVM